MIPGDQAKPLRQGWFISADCGAPFTRGRPTSSTKPATSLRYLKIIQSKGRLRLAQE